MTSLRTYPSSRLQFSRGVSLVELMIAMVLGLLVTAGAIGIFLASNQTYRATQNLSQIQESARAAFELMARDVREAGGSPCERNLPIANALNGGTNWWASFGQPVIGFDGNVAMPGAADLADGTGGGNFGTGAGQRVEGTQAIQLKSAMSNNVTVADHQPTSADMKLNTANHGLRDGDIAMVCDFRQVGIFQISNVQPGVNDNLVHNTGGTISPGNSTRDLGTGTDGTPTAYAYGCATGVRGQNCPSPDTRKCKDNSQTDAQSLDPVTGSCRPWSATVAKITSSRWYIGNSMTLRPDGTRGRSLFRVGATNSGGSIVQQRQEIATDVESLTLAFLPDRATSYQSAASITDWDAISAVRITLALSSPEAVGTDDTRLQRSIEHVVTLRNRIP